MGLIRNQVIPRGIRGFESLPLRHTKKGPTGAFFGMAEREALMRTLWFDQRPKAAQDAAGAPKG